MSNQVVRYDDASLLCAERMPAIARNSSLAIGWSSLLLEQHDIAPGTYDLTTTVTPDIQLVVALNEGFCVQGREEEVQRISTFRPGSLGMLNSLESQRLRCRFLKPQRMAQVFLPSVLTEEVAEEVRRAGQKASRYAPTSLRFEDAALSGVIASLVAALERRLPELYCEQAAQWMAVHIVSFHNAHRCVEQQQPAHHLSDRRLRRVLDMMSVNFSAPLTLDAMAREAGVSKFHFVRLFKAKLGLTPARYLEKLRMERAQALLKDGDLQVAEVSYRVGYASADQFSAAFRRTLGTSPSTFRKQTRR